MKKLCAGLFALALLFGTADLAHGQVSLGPEISIADNVDFGIGAVLEAALGSLDPNLEMAARFTLYFPDGIDYWELNGDLRYLFPLTDQNQIIPYVLGGIAIGHASYDGDRPGLEVNGGNTEVGVRLGGGLKFPMDRITPFAELGLGVGDIPDFSLRGGLTFPMR